MPIAIVGMACRFAGDVSCPEKLWQLCADGKSAWKAIPESRFAQKEVYHPDNQKQGTVRYSQGRLSAAQRLIELTPRQMLKEDISWRRIYPSSMQPFSTFHPKWPV